MKKPFISLFLALACTVSAWSVDYTPQMQGVLDSYLPHAYGYATPRVKKVTVNKKSRTVTVVCNESTAYLPLTLSEAESLVKDCKAALPKQYAKYKINVVVSRKSGDQNIKTLALGSKRTVKGPTEKHPFVTRHDAPEAPRGLDGKNIAMWQSHGWYFEPKLNRWEWQRARVMQTVEDLYTQSYVMPYLMPMLENAGAYVMSPRERDTQAVEYIIDNDSQSAYTEHNGEKKWSTTPLPGFGNKGEVLTVGVNPFRNGTARQAETTSEKSKVSTATYTAPIAKDGNYAVYVSYQTLSNSAPDAQYTVHAATGDRRFTVNQKMGGGTWVYLGHFPFKAGDKKIVTLENVSSHHGTAVTADAVKVGGGMGNVARIVKEPLDSIDYEYVLSGYPRFTEGARYWLQWAGAPDSVYTPTDNVNDYTDDYSSRGLWVNWLAGGSSMLPEREGLNIPVDLSFAFHSDAGTTLNDSVIGSLGIYYSQANDGKYANGTDRMASRDLTNLVLTNITRDVRAGFEPDWTRRGMWDQSYYEARVPEVPAMLLELLSHQNFADMKYGLDPNFRFTVSRGIYKGIGQFLAARDGKEFVVQPLPVHAFAINRESEGRYTLSWQATPDSLEASALPTYYIIEHCTGDPANGFTRLAESTSPQFAVTIDDTDIHSYRIVAANDGGVSFPSEVLSLCDMPGTEPVLIVNGFTRVSAPDNFDSGEIAGFYDVRDHGVPYLNDISFIGSQFEYRRDIPWMDDDAAGFGASRSDYEKEVVAGNTFDYPYVHGEAIRAAGHGFYSASVEAYSAGTVTRAPMVDLILGKQKEIRQGRGYYGTRYKTFPSELQNRIALDTSAGTSMFISGAYVATDLWDNPYSSKEVAEADQKFATEVLGYHWRVGQASVTGQAYTVASRYKEFTHGEYTFSAKLNPECYAVESPDSFYASSKQGATIMRYNENNLIAGIAYAPAGYRTVVIGFPFETITSAESRSSLMRQILSFLDKK